MLVKFHKPYNPNDGHGPGVPLPDGIYEYLMKLDGQEDVLEQILESLNISWPGYIASDYGDFIEIRSDRHHWWGIGYAPVAP